MQYTKEFLEEQYTKISEDLREALSSVEIIKSIELISKTNGLMLDQAEELADHIGLIVLGLERTESFNETIAKKLNINKEKADIITRQVNDLVFLKVRESLKKFHLKQLSEKAEQERKKVLEAEKQKSLQVAQIKKHEDLLKQKKVELDAQPINLSPIKSENLLVIKKNPTTESPSTPITVLKIKPTTPVPIQVPPPKIKIEPKPPIVVKEPPKVAPKPPIIYVPAKKPDPVPVKPEIKKEEPKPIPKPEVKHVPPKIQTSQPTQQTQPSSQPATGQPTRKGYTEPYLMNRERILFQIENPVPVSYSPHWENTKPPETKIYTDHVSEVVPPKEEPKKEELVPQIKPEPKKVETPKIEVPKITLPEIMPEHHITIKKGETVHDVPPSNPTPTPKPSAPLVEKPAIEEKKPVNFMDHKLSNPVTIPKEEKVKDIDTPQTKAVQSKPYTTDPYREPI